MPMASDEETRKAIAAAEKALPEWSATPPAKRAQVMFKFRELLYEHMDELGEVLSGEHGKTIPDAKGSVTRGLEVVEFACGIPHLLKGEYSDSVSKGGGVTPFGGPPLKLEFGAV